MKYKTFARIRFLVVTLLLAIPAVFLWFGCEKVKPSTPAQPVVQQQLPPPTAPSNGGGNAVSVNPNPGNPAPTGDTAAFTDVHQAIIRLQKEPLSNGVKKSGTLQWVYKDAGIRAEFRCDQDKGFNYWNRVKIDYNGNKRDEERWDFKKDGAVKRRVAPKDDENFTETYALQGQKWVRK